MNPETYPGSEYYPLFKHMQDEHGLILTCTEMTDIIQIVKQITNQK